MADLNPLRIWRSFLALSNDSPVKTLIFALLLALSASVIVSMAAVILRPYQLANLERERQARMAEIVAALPQMSGLLDDVAVDRLEVRIVDLSTGAFAEGIDPAGFDQRQAARDPELSTELPPEQDIAGLKRRSDFAPVYLLRGNGRLRLVILPVRGLGYQSMLYAYLALQADGNTIAGLTFYEQGDTPGFGARVEEPEWQALWQGKQIADEDGTIRITVVRGEASGPYEVEGITGATGTSNGVANMLKFWLGAHGFGSFLDRLRAGEV